MVSAAASPISLIDDAVGETPRGTGADFTLRADGLMGASKRRASSVEKTGGTAVTEIIPKASGITMEAIPQGPSGPRPTIASRAISPLESFRSNSSCSIGPLTPDSWRMYQLIALVLLEDFPTFVVTGRRRFASCHSARARNAAD